MNAQTCRHLTGLTDSHCHLTSVELSKDIGAVLDRARLAGLSHLLTIGQGLDDCRAAIELAHRFPQLHASIGFGPHAAEKVGPEDFQQLTDLAADPQVVAIGETGLDYYYDRPARDVQQQVFARQAELAKQLNLPLVIHCRQAWDDCLAVLDKVFFSGPTGVFHCYTGSAEMIPRLIERGFYVSFAGLVTFKNAEIIRSAAKLVPHDRLLIETDAPYLSPEPMRNVRPNEPALLVHTAEFMAKLLGLPLTELTKITSENARRLFNW